MTRTTQRTITTRGRTKLRIKHVQWRESGAHFRLAIPAHARGRGPYKPGQTHIMRSLKTHDPDEAALQAMLLKKHYKAIFDQFKIDPDNADPKLLMPYARELLGQAYVPITQPAASARDFVAAQAAGISAIINAGENASKLVTAVAVGAINIPALTMDQVLERYKDHMSEKFSAIPDKRAEEKRWNPYAQAVYEWNRAMGKDRDVLSVTSKDVHDEFKKALVELMNAKKFNVETARKKISWLQQICKKVFKIDYDREAKLFDDIELIGGSKQPKKDRSFTDQEMILVRKEFMNAKCGEDLKALATVMELTGTSCKELALLTENDIFLDAEIPFIRIDTNEFRHQVKSGGARHRDLPLIGRALEAMKKFPKGFPRFRRNNGSEDMSALMNKIIKRAAKTRTSYSFRHYQARRVRACDDVKDSLQNSLMGHTTKGMLMRYGGGYELEQKLAALKKIFPEEFNPNVSP